MLLAKNCFVILQTDNLSPKETIFENGGTTATTRRGQPVWGFVTPQWLRRKRHDK